MDRPLGRACGNALEVEEAVLALRGEGPPDLMRVTYALGAEMLLLGGAYPTADAARRAMEGAISSGTSRREVPADHRGTGWQPRRGGRPGRAAAGRGLRAVPRRSPRLHRPGGAARDRARHHRRCMAGETRMEDVIDPTSGFVITARPGDWVEEGEPLATIFAADGAGIGARPGHARARDPHRRRGRAAAAAHLAPRDVGRRGAGGRAMTGRGACAPYRGR